MSYTPSYTRRNYVNNQAPSINAENLNAIEDAIVSLEANAQSEAEKVAQAATKAELVSEGQRLRTLITSVSTELSSEIEAREASEAEMRNEIAKVANSNLQTSSDVLDFAMDGNIQSARFEGYARKSKNLIGFDSNASETLYGVTVKANADGSITLNGTNYADGNLIFKLSNSFAHLAEEAITNEYYLISEYISGSKSGGDARFRLTNSSWSPMVSVDVDNQMRKVRCSSLTIAKGNSSFWVANGVTFNNLTIRLSLQKGDGSTEPFGIIKPSGIVESRGKNLIDYSKRVDNYGLGEDGQLISVANWYATDYIAVNPNTRYVISGLSSIFRAEYDESKKYVKKGNDNTFVTSETTRYVRLNSLKTSTTPQLEEGNTATAYTPYAHDSITLPYVPLGVGDIHDELIVNSDGSGKFIKRTKKIRLSDLNWNYIDTYGFMNSTLHDGVFPETFTPSPAICSKYEDVTVVTNITNLGDGKIIVSWRDISNSRCAVIVKDSNYTDSNTFKQAMATQNVELVYILNTPQEINLTASQVEQILALKTFADTTYIDADGMHYEIGYAQNSAKAIKELQNIIKNMINPQTESQLEEVGQISALSIEEGEETNV